MTQRHWVLRATAVTGNGPAVHDMIRAERTDRVRVLTNLTNELDALDRRWSGVLSKIVLPDTNFYLHHNEYFDEADQKALARPGTYDTLILVPIAVVRELDKKKVAAKNITVSDTNPEPQRTRARVTSRRLRDLIQNPDWTAKIVPGVEIELLLDPLDHRPIDDTDTEIIERALAAKRLAGKDISVLTGDGGMEFGAKIEGLSVISI